MDNVRRISQSHTAEKLYVTDEMRAVINGHLGAEFIRDEDVGGDLFRGKDGDMTISLNDDGDGPAPGLRLRSLHGNGAVSHSSNPPQRDTAVASMLIYDPGAGRWTQVGEAPYFKAQEVILALFGEREMFAENSELRKFFAEKAPVIAELRRKMKIE